MFPPSMLEVSRIIKENWTGSILVENKLANPVLYKLFRVKKHYTTESVCSVTQTKTRLPVFEYIAAVYW